MNKIIQARQRQEREFDLFNHYDKALHAKKKNLPFFPAVPRDQPSLVQYLSLMWVGHAHDLDLCILDTGLGSGLMNGHSCS